MKHLYIFLFSLLFIFSVDAQTLDDTIVLQQHEIISPSNPVEFRQISRTVQVISRNEIQNSTVNSIDELLKIYGGVDIRSRGAMGVQSDISMRAGGFDQGLIMVNGISLNDPQTGHHNLNQAIDLDDIEKIEIFDGPGTRWFGANAFSGGLNIITNQYSNKGLSVSISGGQYAYMAARLAYSYKVGHVSNKTSAFVKRSDGYMRNTDFNIVNFNHNSSFKKRTNLVNLNVGILDKGFGANSFYTSKYPDQYEHIRTYFSSLSYETGSEVKFKSNVYWRRNYDRFELFREDKNWYVKQGDVYINGSDTAGFPTPSGIYPYAGHNYHRTDIAGVDAGINFESILGKTALGVNYKTERIVSNVLGESMNDTIFIEGSDGIYTKSKNRNNISFSANQLYIKNNFSISIWLILLMSILKFSHLPIRQFEFQHLPTFIIRGLQTHLIRI